MRNRFPASTPVNAARSLAVGTVVVLFAGPLAGCVSRIPAAPDRLAQRAEVAEPFAIDWPLRTHGASVPRDFKPIFKPIGAYGRGHLYEFASEPTAAFEGAQILLFVSERPADDPSARLEPLTLFTTLRDGSRHSVTFAPTVTGTVVGVGAPAGPARGIVVYLGSLQGMSRPERTLMDVLLERGWFVLTVAPSGEALAGSRMYVGSRSEPEIVAESIARTLDSFFAEHAFAVEAALQYIGDAMPEAPRRPLALVGGSMGAMLLPAVAARLHGEPDAAVLIGGGADFLRVLMSSPLGRDRLRVLWQDEGILDEHGELIMQIAQGNAADVDAILERVLARTSLDPYHAAGALADVPVLLLHARWDAVVPARFGDLLYDRLNHPERWVYATGHVGLFLSLLFESRRIADWLDRATSRSDS